MIRRLAATALIAVAAGFGATEGGWLAAQAVVGSVFTPAAVTQWA